MFVLYMRVHKLTPNSVARRTPSIICSLPIHAAQYSLSAAPQLAR
jgi:hypothetical protein